VALLEPAIYLQSRSVNPLISSSCLILLIGPPVKFSALSWENVSIGYADIFILFWLEQFFEKW